MGLRSWLDRLGLVNPRTFISYRRSDAGGHAGRLTASLVDYYGDRTVYLDHKSIRGGDDFGAALESALARAEVVLAIIGPDWLNATKNGVRRLDLEGDWVRREIEISLQRRGVRVIPVLVGDAELPSADDLPAPVKRLVHRQQVVTVRPDRFEDDTRHLIKSIGGWRRRWRGIPIYAWAAALTLVLGLTAAALARNPTPNTPPVVQVPGAIEATSGVPIQIDLLVWATDKESDQLTVNSDPVSASDGAITDLGNGTVSYVSARGFTGVDRFAFRVLDEDGLQAETTVTIDVKLGRLEGAFNVAVAEMTGTGPDAESIARTLSDTIFREMSDALESAGIAGDQVAGPALVGPIRGVTSEDRAAVAAMMARDLNAHVILYGTVNISDGATTIVPEFYLAEDKLFEATELAGAYQLKQPEIGSAEPLTLSIAVMDFLGPKLRSLAELFAGLSYYRLEAYADADVFFTSAEEDWPEGGPNANGKEVVFQLLGNVAGLQEDLPRALGYYEQALAIEPSYPRALFGVAEVGFQSAKGPTCGGAADSEADVDQLLTEAAAFEAIAQLPAPPQSFLEHRATIEQARIYLCLAAYGVDRRSEARQLAQSVIDSLGDPLARNVVAEAHQVLATDHLLSEDADQAILEYRLAIERSLLAPRDGFFHQAIAYVEAVEAAQATVAGAERKLENAQAALEGLRQEHPLQFETVVAPEPPSSPAGPGVLMIAGLGLLVGGFVGAGVALVADARDRSFRDARSVSEILGLPTLGAIDVMRTPAEERRIESAHRRRTNTLAAMAFVCVALLGFALLGDASVLQDMVRTVLR